MKTTTRNPNPPIRIVGHVDVPPSAVVTLDTKDREDLNVGRPIILNKRRYILTARVPELIGMPGEKVSIVLGLDNRGNRQQRRRQAKRRA